MPVKSKPAPVQTKAVKKVRPAPAPTVQHPPDKPSTPHPAVTSPRRQSGSAPTSPAGGVEPSQSDAQIRAVPPAAPGLAGVLPLLTLQVRDREFLLNTDLRYRNSMAAYIRRMLGYNPFMPKNEAAPLIEKAQAVLKHVMDFGDVVPGCELECKAAWNLHQTMDYNPLRNADAVKRRETAIVAYYPDLPGQELVESVPGLGELAYALFIGTVGDVSRFASVSAFWKYCGLAVDENGRRIPRKAKRCAAYRMMTPVMKRANVYRDFYLLEKDRITGKRENGDYGEDAIISPHKRAERHATKEMLKDIWLAWAEKPARTRAQVLGKFGDYEAKLTRIKDDLARAKAEKKQREED